MFYSAEFTCDGHTLALPGHAGGHIDWHSVDGDTAFTARAVLPRIPRLTRSQARLTYPGAPNTRFWQIEDARVDIGGYPPDRSHFPSMLLADLMSSHGTQWFLFPITAAARQAISIERVEVKDGFDQVYSSVDRRELRPPDEWALFRVKNLDPNTLLVWSTVLSPLSGSSLEEMLLGIDEYSNLLWAVERRINSRDVRTPSAEERRKKPATPPAGPINSPEKAYDYLPSVDAVPFWQPYKLDVFDGKRHFIQARLADYTLPVAGPMNPPATAALLRDPKLVDPAPVHVIDPATVPAEGLLLERRWMLARDANGQPLLWVQRRRSPLLTPPARQLRFDVVEPA